MQSCFSRHSHVPVQRSRDPTKWGCEREQGAGAPHSGDATVRESLAATGKNLAGGGNAFTDWHEAARRNAGGDRRIATGHRRYGA